MNEETSSYPYGGTRRSSEYSVPSFFKDDEPHSSRPPGRDRHDRQRLSLKDEPSSSPEFGGFGQRRTQSLSLRGDDPLSDPLQHHHYQRPTSPGPVHVGAFHSPPTGSGASNYSFDAVAAKIAANDAGGGGPTGQETTIEISPGVMARLRGAQETWECIEQDFYMPVSCFACASDLCCIQDACYVLCPNCRVVSPMDGMDPQRHDGGVGLGFTMDDLCRWQSEILMKRSQQGHR